MQREFKEKLRSLTDEYREVPGAAALVEDVRNWAGLTLEDLNAELSRPDLTPDQQRRLNHEMSVHLLLRHAARSRVG